MKKIKIFIKQNKLLYYLYNIIVSAFLRTIGLFVKTDDKLVLFNSFGGARFDDSSKAIYDYMINCGKYNDFKLVWTFDQPDLYINNILCVKNNSFKFFITALKAKYWITNSSMERGLKFKKKKTVYINTWHGSALKFMGNDIKNSITKYNVSEPDYFYCQSQYDRDVFSKAYGYTDRQLPIVGLPRNDELCFISKQEINSIKKKLNLPLDKKVILYAPTFREYDRDFDGCIISPPINLAKWEKKLAGNYVLLFRAHYEISKVLNIKSDNFIHDMTNYSHLNDLLKISDILISDYSSIIIDFSILERPIYSFAYDYNEYKDKRGLYFDLDKLLPNGIQTDEDALLDEISKCNFSVQLKKTRCFKSKFVEKCGSASQYIDKIIIEKNN